MCASFDNNNVVLNEIVASPRTGEWLYCSGSEIYWYPEQFIDFLLAESATRVYVPAWEAEQMSLDVSSLSDIAKTHIKLIDKNQKIFYDQIIEDWRNRDNYVVDSLVDMYSEVFNLK